MSSAIGKQQTAPMPIERAARILLYTSDKDYDGVVTPADVDHQAGAMLGLANRQVMNHRDIQNWLRTYDGRVDGGVRDGKIDGTEERKIFWDLGTMAEHLYPEETSVTLAELATTLLQAHAGSDGVIDASDTGIVPRALRRMCGRDVAVAGVAELARMLVNFDVFDHRTREYGSGHSDGRIGDIEYPEIDRTAGLVAQSLIYEDQQAGRPPAPPSGS